MDTADIGESKGELLSVHLLSEVTNALQLTEVIAVYYVQFPRRQLEKRGTLVLAEFETKKGNKRYRYWSSSLKYIDGGQLALDELKDFWKQDMQVILKQVIGATVIGFVVGFMALELAKYKLPQLQ